MSEDEFTKLFKYMKVEFAKVHKRLDQTASNEVVNRMINSIDAYAKNTEKYMQEMLSLGHKVDRLEQWILKVAEATGVKLSS